jgi:acyl-CoA thioesterase I
MKKPGILSIGLLGAGLLLLAACGRAPSLRPLAPGAVVLAFGDSLTAGTGAEPDEAYPAVLGRMLGRTVINAGRPGERVSEGRDRLPAAIAASNPSLVILCHGGNDLLQRRPPEEIEADLDHMIRFLRAQGIDVLLVGVPEPTLLRRTAPFYRRLARRYDLPFEATLVGEILSDPALKSDPIHPNAQGYRIVAEALANAIP